MISVYFKALKHFICKFEKRFLSVAKSFVGSCREKTHENLEPKQKGQHINPLIFTKMALILFCFISSVVGDDNNKRICC